MADPQKATKNGGLTRGKAIFIAVLGVVLVSVLYVQFGRGSADNRSEPSAYVSRRAPAVEGVASSGAAENANVAAPAAASTSVAMVTVVDASRWKSPKLEDVVDYDPFALPDSFPKRQAAEATANIEDLAAAAAREDSRKLAEAIQQLKSDLQQLQQVGVQVIVRQGDQFVAMIGDRTVHVGEEIKGFTVTKIDAEGVVVERKAPE
jgi:hypothetical protein